MYHPYLVLTFAFMYHSYSILFGMSSLYLECFLIVKSIFHLLSGTEMQRDNPRHIVPSDTAQSVQAHVSGRKNIYGGQ